jgi:hypothetical protein
MFLPIMRLYESLGTNVKQIGRILNRIQTYFCSIFISFMIRREIVILVTKKQQNKLQLL